MALFNESLGSQLDSPCDCFHLHVSIEFEFILFCKMPPHYDRGVERDGGRRKKTLVR